ncbi:hypothetical protein GOBAR_AA22961 [Gossypium barbadense]|uniref:Uncharacterized protein n=1 Tax=Gossypium barbadense TaxID=3634 RepID=A0A2P5X2X8_GOSBA|nr:hypothetical protein GOBAR_AA22961 [Gossypium barbadense]
MNRCSLQENASVSAYDHQRGGPVVCPKPRRIGVLANNPNRPLRLHLSHQAEVSDLRAGAELLDIILKKEDFGIEQSATQVASSPPFFCGSPPSRVSNPLVQDAQFQIAEIPASLLRPKTLNYKCTYRKIEVPPFPKTRRVKVDVIIRMLLVMHLV